MNVEHKEFIGFYRNVFPDGYCKHMINEFNALQKQSVGANRQQGEGAKKHDKDDYQIFLNMRSHNAEPFSWSESQADGSSKQFERNVVDLFYGGLQDCYDEYVENYSVLPDSGNLRATVIKMQRTKPGGGYHIWHCEQGAGSHANRALVYMLYLNSLDTDGGETEFLYQKLRIKPEENLMLLWPAAYTHAHRGNPVLGETHKYIVTGWFYYD